MKMNYRTTEYTLKSYNKREKIKNQKKYCRKITRDRDYETEVEEEEGFKEGGLGVRSEVIKVFLSRTEYVSCLFAIGGRVHVFASSGAQETIQYLSSQEEPKRPKSNHTQVSTPPAN